MFLRKLTPGQAREKSFDRASFLDPSVTGIVESKHLLVWTEKHPYTSLNCSIHIELIGRTVTVFLVWVYSRCFSYFDHISLSLCEGLALAVFVCLQSNQVKNGYKKVTNLKNYLWGAEFSLASEHQKLLPCVHKGFVKLDREFWMLFFFLAIGRLSFHSCRMPLQLVCKASSTWKLILHLWAHCTVRGWCCEGLVFAAVLLFCAGSFQWSEPVSEMCFYLLICMGFTLYFLLECFLSGCLNCRHQRSAELAFWELAWMLLAEQSSIWTAKPPEMLIRPG